MVRCKFICQSITKSKAWKSSEAQPFVFNATFLPVTDGSVENKSFFEATPSGKLEIGTYKQDLFNPGQEYYIDINMV